MSVKTDLSGTLPFAVLSDFIVNADLCSETFVSAIVYGQRRSLSDFGFVRFTVLLGFKKRTVMTE